MPKDYHCCATCRHFSIRRKEDRVEIRCARLGYQTKTSYQFNCWNPREDIRQRMQNEDPASQNRQ